MHDAYPPTFFTRHNRPLRGVMIDNQPWFSAYDFARLLGLHHPQALPNRLKPMKPAAPACTTPPAAKKLSTSSTKPASTRR